ncbi:DMT family protein [Mucilaginibacter terrae]|uniref:DMT family protein n=1 Tax=Mucilaginibacter terrae TaxID=1955052 RepID=UPI00363668B1
MGQKFASYGYNLISWGLAFFEYLFQVPANKAGFNAEGGPFSLVQLKVLQEALSITIFMVFTTILFKT